MSMVDEHTQRHAQKSKGDSSRPQANAGDPYDLSGYPISDGSEFLGIAKKSGIPVFNQDGERVQ